MWKSQLRNCLCCSTRSVVPAVLSRTRSLSKLKVSPSLAILRRPVIPIGSRLSMTASSRSSRWPRKRILLFSSWSPACPPRTARRSPRIGSAWTTWTRGTPRTTRFTRLGQLWATFSSVRSVCVSSARSRPRRSLVRSTWLCSVTTVSPWRSLNATLKASRRLTLMAIPSSSTRRTIRMSTTWLLPINLFTIKGTLDKGVLYYCGRELLVTNPKGWVEETAFWVGSLEDRGFYIRHKIKV